MYSWLALLISVATCGIVYFFFHKRVHWAELIIPFVTTFGIILISKSCAVSTLTSDEEYWGGYVTQVEYHEDWDEWITRTCSYETCSGTGENQTCTTHYYDCSYRDYHPEFWYAETNLNGFSISKARYDQLCKQFGTGSQFKDMNRDYYTDDGDMYYTKWLDTDLLSVEPVAEVHTYENKPQAALNVFKYERPDSSDIQMYGLFDYPPINNHKQETLLGLRDHSAQQRLHYFNGIFGKSKQIRLFILVFRDQPREAGIAQENYWAGGNKNELVICVGVRDNKVSWAHPFSWTDNKRLGVNIRHEIESLSTFDAGNVVVIAVENLHLWKRKEFSDFDYLTVNPTPRQTLWIFFWAVAVQIIVASFIVHNNIWKNGIN